MLSIDTHLFTVILMQKMLIKVVALVSIAAVYRCLNNHLNFRCLFFSLSLDFFVSFEFLLEFFKDLASVLASIQVFIHCCDAFFFALFGIFNTLFIQKY